jgi:hypothetical protein
VRAASGPISRPQIESSALRIRAVSYAADNPAAAHIQIWPQAANNLVPCSKGQQGDVPGLLDGTGQAALVRGANTGKPTRHNLAALSHKPLQQTNIAVRDRINLLGAELADLLAPEKLSASARSAAGTTALRTTATTTRSRRWSVVATLWCCARLRRLAYCFISHVVSSSTLSRCNSHKGAATQMDLAVPF